MSENERPPENLPASDRPDTSSRSSRALDSLLVEARAHLDVREPGAARGQNDVMADVDWERLESRLMTEIEADARQRVTSIEHARARSLRWLRVGALAVAAAAAVVVSVRRDRGVASTDQGHSHVETMPASALRATHGNGEVRIGGTLATPGSIVRAMDAIEVEGARAVFERPHKVSWLVEQETGPRVEAGPTSPRARALVKSADDTLILGLEHGVIEAQVVPVPVGEAFAVDIATDHDLVRVAVHGTHLRVARTGNRVIVDLTEGVVAIGVPPRTGITTGTTITAPAHVELDATDLSTLRIDRAPSSVRAAIPLGAHETARLETVTPPVQAVHPTPQPVLPSKGSPPHVEGTATVPKVEASKSALPPRDAIAAAVRDCAASRNRPGNVQVTVSSSLVLRVSPEGVVETAQFSPPLSPDVQTCAAQTIYKTKLDESGAVTIPIEFTY